MHLEKERDAVVQQGEGRVKDGDQGRKAPRRESHQPSCSYSSRGRHLSCSTTPGLSQVTYFLPPHLPRRQRKRNQRGGASFLLLISAEGIYGCKGCVPRPFSALASGPRGTIAATVLFVLRGQGGKDGPRDSGDCCHTGLQFLLTRSCHGSCIYSFCKY